MAEVARREQPEVGTELREHPQRREHDTGVTTRGRIDDARIPAGPRTFTAVVAEEERDPRAEQSADGIAEHVEARWHSQRNPALDQFEAAALAWSVATANARLATIIERMRCRRPAVHGAKLSGT